MCFFLFFLPVAVQQEFIHTFDFCTVKCHSACYDSENLQPLTLMPLLLAAGFKHSQLNLIGGSWPPTSALLPGESGAPLVSDRYLYLWAPVQTGWHSDAHWTCRRGQHPPPSLHSFTPLSVLLHLFITPSTKSADCRFPLPSLFRSLIFYPWPHSCSFPQLGLDSVNKYSKWTFTSVKVA